MANIDVLKPFFSVSEVQDIDSVSLSILKKKLKMKNHIKPREKVAYQFMDNKI